MGGDHQGIAFTAEIRQDTAFMGKGRLKAQRTDQLSGFLLNGPELACGGIHGKQCLEGIKGVGFIKITHADILFSSFRRGKVPAWLLLYLIRYCRVKTN